MKHYRAINAINRRIVELQNEIEVCNKIVDEPEMMADYNFAKNSEADIANEKLRASVLCLLKALTAITDNIDKWLESGEPADKETSKLLYDNAKIAINKALL